MRPQLGRDKILDAAEALFAEGGFHQTSVDQIARKAGVSKGLTYNYFGSKEELLVAIIERTSGEMATKALGDEPPVGYQIALRSFLARLSRMLKNDGSQMLFQLNLMFDPSLSAVTEPAFKARAIELMESTTELLSLSGTSDPGRHARHLVAEIDGITLHYLRLFADYPLDTVLIELYERYKDIGK